MARKASLKPDPVELHTRNLSLSLAAANRAAEDATTAELPGLKEQLIGELRAAHSLARALVIAAYPQTAGVCACDAEEILAGRLRCRDDAAALATWAYAEKMLAAFELVCLSTPFPRVQIALMYREVHNAGWPVA